VLPKPLRIANHLLPEVLNKIDPVDILTVLVGRLRELLYRRDVIHRDSHINPVLDILHGLSENAVVHQLEEILLKVRLRLGSSSGVEINIFLQPGLLLKPENLMNPRHLEASNT
jgi:hypothetical protein